MEVPAGLPVVSQTEGGWRVSDGRKCDSWIHFGDGGLMGKRHFQRPNANLLIINQRVWGFWSGGGVTQPKKNHRFYRGHLNRVGGKKNSFHPLPLFLLAVWRATPVSIRLKGVLLMLHLSLPIVNSVAPFPP